MRNKQFGIVAFLLIVTAVAKGQLNPVAWNFTAKKIDDRTYELHMKASIQPGWHMFSQMQPEDAIAIPTGFVLNNNPLVKFDGNIREVGKMERFHDDKLKLSANQYANEIDFVQNVKLKAKAKTNVTGTVEYQTCNDQKCLPPKKVNFTIPIQ